MVPHLVSTHQITKANIYCTKFDHVVSKTLSTIAGYKIEKGWSVNLDVVSIHHDPEVFPDPQKFDPSRFDVSTFFTKPFSFLLLSETITLGNK